MAHPSGLQARSAPATLFLNFISFFFLFSSLVTARDHASSGHRHAHQKYGMAPTNSSIAASNSTDAAAIIAQALAAIRVANKARIEKPSFNKNEFASKAELEAEGKPAAPLDLSLANSTSESGSVTRRKQSDSDAKAALPYTIPKKIAEAAKKLAESHPQVPKGDHAEVAARIRAKYSSKNNDTNAPEPEKRPEGRLGAYGKHEGDASKRAASYWMLDEAPSGHAPFAGDGYKVRTALANNQWYMTLKHRHRSSVTSKTTVQRVTVAQMIQMLSIVPSQTVTDVVPIVVAVLPRLLLCTSLRERTL